jgi:hypothetical protein
LRRFIKELRATGSGIGTPRKSSDGGASEEEFKKLKVGLAG